MSVTSSAWGKRVPGHQKEPLHLCTAAPLHTLWSDSGINSNKHMTLFLPKISRHSILFHVGSLCLISLLCITEQRGRVFPGE